MRLDPRCLAVQFLAVRFPALLPLAPLLLAVPFLAVLPLARPPAHFRGGCAASVRRGRSGSFDKPAEPDRPVSHVSSRARRVNRAADVHPRAVRHDRRAEPSAGSASRPVDCTAACW